MTPEEKIQAIQDQVVAIQNGYIDVIECPYCGIVNKKGELCCATLVRAVQAILDNQDMMDKKEIADRIQDKTYVN